MILRGCRFSKMDILRRCAVPILMHVGVVSSIVVGVAAIYSY